MSVITTRSHRASAPLLAVYALLALTGVVTHAADVRVASLCVLIAAVSTSLPGRVGRRGWLLWLTVVAVVAWFAADGRVTLVLGMVPVTFNAALCWLFARTLRRGHEPLVLRIIRVLEGEARLALPGVRSYARHVTLFWALLMGAQTAIVLLLWVLVTPGGLLAVTGLHARVMVPVQDAAWYTHLGVYVLPVLAMLVEYGVRRLVLRGMPHLSLPVFGRRLIRCWPHVLREAAAP